MKKYSFVFLIISGVLYFTSLFLPAFHTHSASSRSVEVFSPKFDIVQETSHDYDKKTDYMGYSVLAWGWWGIFMYQFAWLANLIFLTIMVMSFTKAYKPGLAMSLIAILLCLQSFLFKKIPLDEGGVRFDVVDSLGLGFYLWISSFVVLALYNGLGMLSSKVAK